MKKITLLFLLSFLVAKTYAQNYQITFAGTGASTAVDSVKVENLTQCTDTFLGGSDILHLSPTVGINELNTDADNTIHIYPNPMTGSCSIDFEATAQGKTTIGLYDITGKRITQVQESLLKGHHIYSLSGISSGIYMLKIESDKYSYTAKLISANEDPGNVLINEIIATSHIPSSYKIKDGKNLIAMLYYTSDQLKFTGYSGNYKTVYMLVATQDQTITFNFIPCTDADNNNYAVVQIGTQIWMAENLKTLKYTNGDFIPNVTDMDTWSYLTTGAYCHYNNSISFVADYGELYNWYAVVDPRTICPAGWHPPTDDEWTTLTNYLGGDNLAGGKLKENCSIHWQSPNAGATNETGFTALPGGYRDYVGEFMEIGTTGVWWSSTELNIDFAWHRDMEYNDGYVKRHDYPKDPGFSVRCLKY